MKLILSLNAQSKKFSAKNQEECIAYVIFTVACCCGALLFTDLKFSSLMTFSAAIQCLGFCVLLLQVVRGRGIASISVRTLVLYVILFTFRLYATCFYESYIPVDRSGDQLYQLIEITSLVLVLVTLAKVMRVHADDRSREDNFGVAGIVAVAAAAALCVHPKLNDNPGSDFAWTLSIYLEALAMAPQLFLLTKLGGSVESLQGHYLACTFASRAVMLRLWSRCFSEVVGMERGGRAAGLGILAAHVLACVVLSDFMYIYFRSFRKSETRLMPIAI